MHTCALKCISHGGNMKALSAFVRTFVCSLQWISIFAIAAIGFAYGQTLTGGGTSAGNSMPPSPPQNLAVSLDELIREVEQRNPEIAAAQQSYQASTYVAGQVSAFPDTQVMVQHF